MYLIVTSMVTYLLINLKPEKIKTLVLWPEAKMINIFIQVLLFSRDRDKTYISDVFYQFKCYSLLTLN